MPAGRVCGATAQNSAGAAYPDAHPGLTNRLLAPFASAIGTVRHSNITIIRRKKSRHVGIPTAETFRAYSEKEKRTFKANV